MHGFIADARNPTLPFIRRSATATRRRVRSFVPSTLMANASGPSSRRLDARNQRGRMIRRRPASTCLPSATRARRRGRSSDDGSGTARGRLSAESDQVERPLSLSSTLKGCYKDGSAGARRATDADACPLAAPTTIAVPWRCTTGSRQRGTQAAERRRENVHHNDQRGLRPATRHLYCC